MKPRLLQLGRLNPVLEASLAEEFDTHPLWREADPAAFLAKHGGEFVGHRDLGPRRRRRCDDRCAAGIEGNRQPWRRLRHDRPGRGETPRRRGRITPDVLTNCVADLGFALVMAAARSLTAADRFVRRGAWKGEKFPLATRVTGKRLGILGLGRIGRTVAKRSAGFDMEVRYHDIRAIPDVPYGYEPSLLELARWADFLVIASAGGPETRHLINAEILVALGPKGFLINIARGTVVDEAALVDALVNKRIAGAGLDVFEDEPNVPEALFTLDNVVLLPHIASATNETRQAMADLVMANLRNFFSEGKLLTPIA